MHGCRMTDTIIEGEKRSHKGHREIKTLWTNCGFFSPLIVVNTTPVFVSRAITSTDCGV